MLTKCTKLQDPGANGSVYEARTDRRTDRRTTLYHYYSGDLRNNYLSRPILTDNCITSLVLYKRTIQTDIHSLSSSNYHIHKNGYLQIIVSLVRCSAIELFTPISTDHCITSLVLYKRKIQAISTYHCITS